ncbi:MAG: AAA family ATPase, partial [Deltaproteobacteria bacterium]|nr:AAA family ATPase [Deltaproteobacteria bacterium]
MKIERYVFPPFTVDTREGNLRRDAQDIVLRAKTFAVLSHLLDRAGQLVSKDELLEQVWAGTYVAEGALTVCITEIRKALGDDPKQPRFIATVPKRGYRFIAKVVSREENTQRAQVELLSPAPSTQHPTPNFVGREAELAQLHSLFAKARDGQRQLVFVTGEPGIGKTTLVETFLFEVRSREEFGGEEEEERQNSKLSTP